MKKKALFFLIPMLFIVMSLNACGDNNTETNLNKENDEQLDTEMENDLSPGKDERLDEINDDMNNNNEEVDKDAGDNNTDRGNNDDKENGQADEAEADPKTEVVMENDAFRVFEPAPNSEVDNEFIVRGQARTFEANVLYEFEDGHYILDQGFVTASQGAPEWGDFEITIRFDELTSDHGTIILFEESAKDGERIHELMIPVKHKK